MASLNTIDAFIRQVEGEKVASDGGKPLSEPGSIGGETTHPVKKVDDRLEAPKTGERSKENSKDVKDAVGAVSVEGKPDAPVKAGSILSRFAKSAEGAVSQPGSAVDDHQGVTLKIAPTGEDKSHETASAKAGKDDKKQGNMGGTTHPASTENDSLDGHKFASYSVNDPLEKLAAVANQIGTAFLSGIHTTMQKQAEYQQQQPANYTQPAMSATLAHDFGAEMAGILTGNLDKRAADNMVLEELATIVKLASYEADLLIDHVNSLQKAAEGMPPEMAGGDPSGMPPGGGASPPGGGMPPPGGGMPPPGGGGGDPSAMMGALGGDAGGGGGGGSDPAAGQHLLQLLDMMGIDPAELAAEIEQGGSGGGGGGGGGGEAPPGGGSGGGEPAPEPGPEGAEAKTAAARVAPKTPTKAAPISKQGQAASYLTELLSRGRR